MGSILYLWPFRDYSTFHPDEGIILQGAQRILQGQVLYRDFFSFFTPGSYYWLALLFKIFGSSFLVGRTVLLVYGGLFSVLTYLLARRVCARWSAILVAYLLLATCLPFGFLVIHNWDSTLWALLALYCAVWLFQAPHWAWALGAASCAALTFLFEQSKGAGVVLGLLMGFLVLARGYPHLALFRGRYLAGLLAGLTWPFLLTVAYFGFHHSLSQMLAAWFWPLQHYVGPHRLPYGYLGISSGQWSALYGDPSWARRVLYIWVTSPCFLIPVLPFAALGFAGFHTFQALRKKQTTQAVNYYVLVSATASGLTFAVVATGRPDFPHILFLAPVLFVVLAWIVEGQGGIRSALRDALQPLLVVFLIIFFTAFGMMLLWGPLSAHEKQETRRGVLRVRAVERSIQYLQEHVSPGANVLVYPHQPLYYFLTATFSPTRYEYLQPGLHTPAQFQEAAEELGVDRTQTVLYNLTFNDEILTQYWPTTRTSVLEADPVKESIFSRYRPCRVFASDYGRGVFMARKDLACPCENGAR